jgi:hypothetical protein
MDIVTAKMVPVGATIKRAYWSAPRGYVNPGPEFTSEADALVHAITEVREAVAKHNAYYPNEATRVPLPERMSIDLRWEFSYPEGGGVDTVVVRTEFKNITEAEEHLARLIKHRKVA